MSTNPYTRSTSKCAAIVIIVSPARTWEKVKSKKFTFLHIHTYYTEGDGAFTVYTAP